MGKIVELIGEDAIRKKTEEMAEIISRDYEGEELYVICILKGSVFFACDLSKRITVPVNLDFMSVSSYGAGTVSSGEVVIKKDLDESIEGRNVLLVEDIIDSGRTLKELVEILKRRNPKSLEVVTLLDKPERREFEVDVKYTCFEIPDKFVVGYGMDYDQKYRNLPYVGVMEA